MTEAEWLASDDPTPMLEFLAERATDRKLRLFACACCDGVVSRLSRSEQVRRFIEKVEEFADGQASSTDVGDSELDAWQDHALKWRNTHDPIWLSVAAVGAMWPALRLDTLMLRGCEAAGYDACGKAAEASSRSRSYRWWRRGPKLSKEEVEAALSDGRRAERRMYSGLVRDIFGNPFRPATFATEWLTDTVLALARQMYNSRDFGAMPILADALQDAGCVNEDILNHCRGRGVHVRGCWVIDLVLGKELGPGC